MSLNNDKQRQRIIFVNDAKIDSNSYENFISLSTDNPNIVFFTNKEMINTDINKYYNNDVERDKNYFPQNIYIGGKKFVPIQGIATKQSSVIINDYMFTLSLDPTYGLLGLSKQISFNDFEFVGIYSPYIIKNTNNTASIQYIYNVEDNDSLSAFKIKNNDTNNSEEPEKLNIIYNNIGLNTNLVSDDLKNTICIVIKYKLDESAIDIFTEGPDIILLSKNDNNENFIVSNLLELKSFYNHQTKLFKDNNRYIYISYFYQIKNFDVLDNGLQFIFTNFSKVDLETNKIIDDIPDDFILKYVQEKDPSITNINAARTYFNNIEYQNYQNKKEISEKPVTISPVIDEFEVVAINNSEDPSSWINTYPLYINSIDSSDEFNLSQISLRIAPNRSIYYKNYKDLLDVLAISYDEESESNNVTISIVNKDTLINTNVNEDTLYIDLNDAFSSFNIDNDNDDKYSSISKANYSISASFNENTVLETINNNIFNLYKYNITPLKISLSTYGTAQISSTSIVRQKSSTIQFIDWNGGSIQSTINSGSNAKLNIGTVLAHYELIGTATITTAYIKGTLKIESSNIEVIPNPTNIIKNGGTTITAIGGGVTTITVKDDDKIIQTFIVTVNNEDPWEVITDRVTFTTEPEGSGSITNTEIGTIVTAPRVDIDTLVTIKCTYLGINARQTVTYTAKASSTTTYHWYVGTTRPIVSSDVTSSGWTVLNSKPSQISVNTNMVIPPVVWYVAIPHEYGFQPYDSTGGAPDSAGWTKSQVTIQNVLYDVFTLNGYAPRVNAIYKV